MNEDHRAALRSVSEHRLCKWCHELFAPRGRASRQFCSRIHAAAWFRHDHQSRLELARAMEEGRA